MRTIRTEDAPADLDEKTAIYAAVETLRCIVGKVDNEPMAAAAAWHAEPYIRRLCAVFQDPIDSIRITPDNFIVIRGEVTPTTANRLRPHRNSGREG